MVGRAREVPLVGRDRELDRLHAALHTTRRPDPPARRPPRAAPGAGAASPVAVVSGPAGIGKSGLLAALGRAAVTGGSMLLTGAATQFEATAALAAVTAALAPLAGTLTAADRAALGPERLAELGGAFRGTDPGGADPGGAEPGRAARALGDERYRTARAVAALLARAAARSP
ncbi:MAG: ATP-binding protein, partial [Pseudonocardia sp.]